jgi:hypothetical protein
MKEYFFFAALLIPTAAAAMLAATGILAAPQKYVPKAQTFQTEVVAAYPLRIDLEEQQ